jgi:hypothetical protein
MDPRCNSKDVRLIRELVESVGFQCLWLEDVMMDAFDVPGRIALQNDRLLLDLQCVKRRAVLRVDGFGYLAVIAFYETHIGHHDAPFEFSF